MSSSSKTGGIRVIAEKERHSSLGPHGPGLLRVQMTRAYSRQPIHFTMRHSSGIHVCFTLTTTLFSAIAAAQVPLRVEQGFASGDRVGTTVAAVGDVDNDGVEDYGIGLPQNGAGSRGGGIVRVFSGATGALLWTNSGNLFTWFGASLAPAGDVNQDGYDDFLVGAPSPLYSGGQVFLVSGRFTVDPFTSQFLAVHSGGGELGASVCGVGDLDGDGFPEYAAGAPSEFAGPTRNGRVHVYSGKTHQIYATTGYLNNSARFGETVARCGDIDGDGIPDLLVGAPLDDTNGTDAGAVFVLKGTATPPGPGGLTLALSLFGRATGDRFGSAIAGGADIDDDGSPDFAVGAPYHGLGANAEQGEVLVWSTGRAAPHQDLFGQPGQRMGEALDLSRDWTGDGRADLVIGLSRGSVGLGTEGLVDIYSVQTRLAPVHVARSAGRFAGGAYGTSVASVADLDADGIPELLAGAPLATIRSKTETGEALLYSGASLPAPGGAALFGGPPGVSVSAGGMQTLLLDFGPDAAGGLYFVGGTSSGFTPGFFLGGRHVPLNVDNYTLATIAAPNTAMRVMTFGTLDSQGRATAQIVVPTATSPSLAGTVLHHAAVTLTLGGGLALDEVTAPLQLDLEP